MPSYPINVGWIFQIGLSLIVAAEIITYTACEHKTARNTQLTLHRVTTSAQPIRHFRPNNVKGLRCRKIGPMNPAKFMEYPLIGHLDELYLIHPYIKPHCIQVVTGSIISAAQCSLPPYCGTNHITKLTNNWFYPDSILCSGIQTEVPVPATGNLLGGWHASNLWAHILQFQVWDGVDLMEFTEAYTSNFFVAVYADGSYQIVTKYLLDHVTTQMKEGKLTIDLHKYFSDSACYCQITTQPLLSKMDAFPDVEFKVASQRYTSNSQIQQNNPFYVCNSNHPVVETQYWRLNETFCLIEGPDGIALMTCKFETNPCVIADQCSQVDNNLVRYLLRVATMVISYTLNVLILTINQLFTLIVNLYQFLNGQYLLGEYLILTIIAMLYLGNPYKTIALTIFVSTIVGFNRA